MKLCRYAKTTRITNYCPIPRALFRQGLSPAAMVLYALLLDRGTLSQKNDYADPSGWIYVTYTQEELALELEVSTRMVRHYLTSLEEKGLLRRSRLSQKQPNRYYLLIPRDSLLENMTGTGQGNLFPLHGKAVSGGRGKELPAINRKEQQELNNLYQHQEDSL